MTRLLRWSRRPSDRQHQFAFLERAENLDRLFRRGIVALTMIVLVVLVAATPAGRYGARRVASGVRIGAQRLLGLLTPREEIDAGWALRRRRDVAHATQTYRRVYDESSPDVQRLLRFAGMGRDDAILRWGNYDKILVLPSAVFAADDAGRSYRLRPNTRSIWLRGVDLTHHMNGFFLVPDTPGLPALLEGTTARIVPGTAQTTNSWGCRGPEPDPSAPIRGLVLGDSSMQGYFVGDNETPPARLGVEIGRRLGVRTSILNTGHLGYSPEQYYHTLVEFAGRFRPQFVVVALCANDFGDIGDAISGRGDLEEASYWLGLIEDYCRTRTILCVTAPIPYDQQVTGIRHEGGYPGQICDVLRSGSLNYCFPIEDLVDEFVRLQVEAIRSGAAISANPLYNLHLEDHHFSPRGAEVWGRSLGRRIGGLLEREKARKSLSF